MELKLFGIKARLEVVIICVIIGYFIGGMVLCSCSKVSAREGFALLSGKELPHEDHSDNTWLSHAAKEQAEHEKAPLAGNQGGSVPLPPGQLDFFYANKFDPSCCSTTSYSGSNGCPCISPEQMEYLNSRAGNRDMSESGSLY